MGNQQLCVLTDNEIQLLISSYFGDGCFCKSGSNIEYDVRLSCIHESSLLFKKNLLSSLQSSDIKLVDNSKGFNKKGFIYRLSLNSDKRISEVYHLTFEEKLDLLNDLGLALWFYDDGSLHKNKMYYNLCTHSFTYEQNTIIAEKLKKFNIKATLTKETKKDGRIFWYIQVGKYNGAKYVSECLSKYNIPELSYKAWSSSTMTQVSTLQEEWKRRGQISSLANFARTKLGKSVMI